jgi:Domain of unknown function (DUF4384)
MSVTPQPDDDDRTVRIPAPTIAVMSAEPTASRPLRKRLRAFSAVAGIMLLAMIAGSVIAGGAFFLLRGKKSLTVPSQPAQEAAAPQAKHEAALPAPPPAASTPDRPFSPREMLNEIFEGRNRGHSVTASVDKGEVRIGSARPGYVYVLAAGSDVAVLFVAVLFPNAADTNNHIRPGQTLTLPDSKWPTNAQFLAIVSDEPRDFVAVGPMAGKVVCPSTTQCSESYGAVVFSSSAVSAESRTRDTARDPAAPKAPAARPTNAVSRRCSDILERASLGEVLTAEEYTFLRRECR